MEKVLDVYKRAYAKEHPVVCLDESPKQLIGEARTPIKTKQGQTLYDYEYVRNGVCDIYMIFEPLAGKRYISVRDNHTRFDWVEEVANLVENIYVKAEKITLVQDNLTAHKPAAFYEVFEPRRAKRILDKLEFVFTPKHGSWLNIAECELSILSRQCTGRRIKDKKTLIKEIQAWQKDRNNRNSKVNWQFTTADARIKLKKLYPTINS
jgi:hypothetical protein